MDEDVEEIIKHILRKLVRMRKIGGAHTEITNLTKGLSYTYRSTRKGKKKITKALKELRRRRFLLDKPSTGEIHVSINPRMIKEIQDLLKET